MKKRDSVDLLPILRVYASIALRALAKEPMQNPYLPRSGVAGSAVSWGAE